MLTKVVNQILKTFKSKKISVFPIFIMGQNISALRGILSSIETIIGGLRSLVSADLVRQGLAIVAKIKDFIAAFPWYYSAAFAVAVFIYFLPEILNMLADWIRALRSAWENLKKAWRGGDDGSKPDSDAGTEVAQLEKRIKELEAENKKLENLLEENRQYAAKNNITPVNIFVQNNHYNTNTNERKETRKTTNENVLYN